MVRAGLSSIVMLLRVLPLAAQSDELATFLAPHRYPITVSEDAVAGEGLRMLLDAAAESHFVLFGERHFTHEIPLFLARVLPALMDEGYSRLALEVGPVGARALASAAAGGTSLPEYGVPFYVTEEERAFVTAFLRGTSDPGRLWGLDHEYLFGMRTALGELAARTDDPRVVARATSMLAEGAEGYDRFFASGRYASLPFFSVSQETLDSLAVGDDATWIVGRLRDAVAVHRSRDGLYKTRRRSEIMRANLLAALMAARASEGSVPRVVFKMGANHTQRGDNDQLLPDVGGFVADLAAGLGSRSLHVAFYQKAGRTVTWIPEAARTGDTIPAAEPHVYAYPPLLLALASDDAWTLFDLRPLRDHLWRQHWLDEEAREPWVRALPDAFVDLVNGQDLVIVIPESTPQWHRAPD